MPVLRVALTFSSPDEELRFLRGLLRVQELADEVLEDCLAQRMGLAAALDVYLTQCARMIHARGAKVRLVGSKGPVLEREWGKVPAELATLLDGRHGAVALERGQTVFIAPLKLADLSLGSLGFVLPGTFSDGGAQVMALVRAIAELLDSAVLSFLALSEGHSPHERLDELHDDTSFRPQARIGRYELVTPLGTGGMAQVMVARTTGPQGVGRLVALKRMLPHLSTDPTMVSLFLDEAKLGLKLQHPNLVTFHDFGQSASGGYFVAMELVRGIDFDQLIYSSQVRLPVSVVSAIVCQALSGLHSAHELLDDAGLPMGLVHRDLSPHNVMVGFDGLVKVLDFGVAKMRSARTVTLPGIVKGKPLYMSPEQAAAEAIDRRSDLFSMGLILFEALMGYRAFDTGNDTRTMEAIVNDPLTRPSPMPPEVWEVVDRALQKHPNERFATAREMRDALERALPPATETEVGQFARERFPERVNDCAWWEQLAADANRRQSTPR